jgi:multidrug efflux pump
MIRFFVRNAATVLLLSISVLVFGWMSYRDLPRESFPDVEIPVVLVSTPYIGVSPEDIEALVTFPLESELAGTPDLKKMSSTSAEGVSIISLEFEPEASIEDALQKVRDRVNRAKAELPEDAEEPTVQEVSFSDFPIMIVNIAGPLDEEQLKGFAEALQDDLERVNGVLDVKLAGGLTRQLRVQVDPVRLASYGLGLGDVTNAIGNENVNIPGGEVKAGGSTFLLRVPGELRTADAIGQVAIKRMGDRPVFIRDIGKVVDGYADRSTYARMRGQPSISISITKRTGTNILEIAEASKQIVAEHAETWPEGVEHRILGDQSEHIARQVSELENNILTALILVVGVLVFALGLRTSLFVALAIPLSMLASFGVLQVLGITLNMVVLFALILALGMLVDNGIVIVENIYRHMEEGKELVEAAVDGTSEVAQAVIASTATTVVAFLPLIWWTGIMGQFMGFMPKTIIIVLISSLVVALVVMPVATAHWMPRRQPGAAAVAPSKSLPGSTAVVTGYRSLLEWSIRRRYLSAFLGFASLIVTMVAYGFLNHGTEFFPNVEPDRATISVRLPDGAELEATDRVVREIEQILLAEPNVDVFVAESGVSGGGDPMAGAQAASNQARLTVDFPPHPNNAEEGDPPRLESTFLTLDRIRAATALIPGAEITVEQERMGPPVGKPISVEVSGDDFHEVGRAAQMVQRELARIDGVTDLSDDYRVGRPEVRLRIDRGAAKRIGASTVQVANDVRTAVAGSKASALRDGADEYDIVVELDPRYKSDLQSVLNLRVAGREDTSPSTFAVPLSTVATATMIGGSGSIRHIDQRLVVTVQGDVEPGKNENAVREAVGKKLAELQAGGELESGVALRLGGADDEQRAAQEFLSWAFMVAVALIALVLVSQFNRFSTMFIILFTVVLSLVGVLWGLILTGTPFGIIMTGLGVISLAGVVVNNAIVLIDYINQLRARGVPVDEAIVQAGLTRFRPVMLTAITTVLGLVPMAIGLTIDFGRARVLLGGPSAEWWGPMAIAVIFGLSFATILTLVMVPTFYSIREDVGDRLARLLSRPSAPLPSSSATGALALVLGLGLLSAGSARAGTVSLEQAWEAAIQSNLDLAIVAEQTRQAESRPGQAWALVQPKLSANASYTFNQHEAVLDFAAMVPEELLPLLGEDFSSEPTVIQAKRQASASFSVVQPLFNGEALPLLSAAYKTAEAARLDEQARRQQVQAGVARAFYGLALAREGGALAEAAVLAAERHLGLAERQVAAGLAPARAMVQARLSLAQAERERAQAQASLVSAGQAFHRLTGLPADSEPVLPSAAAALPATLSAAEADALGKRDDLQAAELRARIARNSYQSKALGFLPVIDARFTEAWSNVAGFTGENWTWMVVLQANWTLWDGGLRLSQLGEQQSMVRMAELSHQRQQQEVREAVRNAWQELERARASLSAVEAELALAEENVQLAERAFQAGTATWLEVSDASLGLDRARIGLLRERMNLDLAAIQLQVAAGLL